MPAFLFIGQILSDKTATDKAKIRIINEKLTYYNAILSSKKYFYFKLRMKSLSIVPTQYCIRLPPLFRLIKKQYQDPHQPYYNLYAQVQ